jgi:hypothetical protein
MLNKRYYTAGQALHPPPSAAFRGKPRGIKPYFDFARSVMARQRAATLASLVNNTIDQNKKSTLTKQSPSLTVKKCHPVFFLFCPIISFPFCRA